MKKTLALLVSATALCTVPASSRPDDMGDFDSFMSDALTDFNSFIDEANRDFINFMRNPWKKYQATEPQEQRTMPEPETQPLYTPATDPSQPQDDTPRQLEIDEILDLTTSQSRQGAKGERLRSRPSLRKSPGQPNRPDKLLNRNLNPVRNNHSGTTSHKNRSSRSNHSGKPYRQNKPRRKQNRRFRFRLRPPVSHIRSSLPAQAAVPSHSAASHTM